MNRVEKLGHNMAIRYENTENSFVRRNLPVDDVVMRAVKVMAK